MVKPSLNTPSSTGADSSLLDRPIEHLQGIGPKRARVLQDAGINILEDLLYYFPRRYLDRSTVTRIEDLKADTETTVVAQVARYGLKRGRRVRFILIVSDGTGYLSCVWFSRISY